MKKKMVPKNLTIRKDQDDWLKKRGGYINLSGLLQRAIDGEMGKVSSMIYKEEKMYKRETGTILECETSETLPGFKEGKIKPDLPGNGILRFYRCPYMLEVGQRVSFGLNKFCNNNLKSNHL